MLLFLTCQEVGCYSEGLCLGWVGGDECGIRVCVTGREMICWDVYGEGVVRVRGAGEGGIKGGGGGTGQETSCG